jgi:hypothetical protein
MGVVIEICVNTPRAVLETRGLIYTNSNAKYYTALYQLTARF